MIDLSCECWPLSCHDPNEAEGEKSAQNVDECGGALNLLINFLGNHFLSTKELKVSSISCEGLDLDPDEQWNLECSVSHEEEHFAPAIARESVEHAVFCLVGGPHESAHAKPNYGDQSHEFELHGGKIDLDHSEVSWQISDTIYINGGTQFNTTLKVEEHGGSNSCWNIKEDPDNGGRVNLAEALLLEGFHDEQNDDGYQHEGDNEPGDAGDASVVLELRIIPLLGVHCVEPHPSCLAHADQHVCAITVGEGIYYWGSHIN